MVIYFILKLAENLVNLRFCRRNLRKGAHISGGEKTHNNNQYQI